MGLPKYVPTPGKFYRALGSGISADKVMLLGILFLIPLDAIRTHTEARARQVLVAGGDGAAAAPAAGGTRVRLSRKRKLRVRGGAFDFMARESGELCGIDDPERAVADAVLGSPLGRGTTRLVSALGIRGGGFDFMARETGELCGIDEPERAVVDAIRTSPLVKALAPTPGRPVDLAVRGGAFDFRAREAGELVGIRNPQKSVVRAIKTAWARSLSAVGIRRFRPKMMLPPRRA